MTYRNHNNEVKGKFLFPHERGACIGIYFLKEKKIVRGIPLGAMF